MIQLSRLKVHRASLQTISLYSVIYPTDMLFSSLVSFAFFLVIFGFVFFEIKNVYSDTHLAIRVGQR